MTRTPGPWERHTASNGTHIWKGNQHIADVDDHDDGRLIAASPELEDALKSLPSKTVRVIDGKEYITFAYAVFATWDAGKRIPAIAKATGQVVR